MVGDGNLIKCHVEPVAAVRHLGGGTPLPARPFADFASKAHMTCHPEPFG